MFLIPYAIFPQLIPFLIGDHIKQDCDYTLTSWFRLMPLWGHVYTHEVYT